MQSYEKLGVFYLGRRYDLAQRKRLPEMLLLESKELTTHGLVVGMTGSGKTGLCFDLIEEAAIDGIPAIVIDPKGDLGNLLLTFPELRPEDFAPWINPDDARRRGLTEAEHAAAQAQTWRQGLADWDQDGERIRRLRAAAEFALYTPGTLTGRPVSVLASFAAPAAEVLDDPELLQERLDSTVTSLLGLVGISADPMKSREAILLSNLFQRAWLSGRPLDLPALIQEVQNPPVRQVGVIDVDSFFPAKDRFELAMQLNHLVASPGFSAWLQGEPLKVNRLLFGENGKPRVAIFSISHLGDAERMFFVTLLLNQVLGWTRSQSGTNSLRALVYMDEIAGYFPPVASPPSKRPLLAMLKQARAFGVGVVLATQNPGDLDYRGLANIGTWFVGRLQTDRDKARVLEGLEGAAAGRGVRFDRGAAEEILAGLGDRVFLLHSVYEDAFTLFESRWAMSYLRGPLSRSQIKALAAPFAVDAKSLGGPGPGRVQAARPGGRGSPAGPAPATSGRPVLPPEVPQFFARVRVPLDPGATLLYQPRLLGVAQVRFVDAKLKVDLLEDVLVMTEITEAAVPVDWAAAEDLAITVNDLVREPAHAEYAPCAPAASHVKNYAAWSRDLKNWIAAERKLLLFHSPSLKQTSLPGEEERDFRIRLQQAARERRDAAAERLRESYAPKLAALEERLRRAEAAREREASQASRAQLDTLVSLGSTLLGAFLGRKALTSTTVGRAASTVRSAGRAADQGSDVGRAQETVAAVSQQLRELEARFRAEVEAVMKDGDLDMEVMDTLELRASRPRIQVRLVALVWLPFRRDAGGTLSAAY